MYGSLADTLPFEQPFNPSDFESLTDVVPEEFDPSDRYDTPTTWLRQGTEIVRTSGTWNNELRVRYMPGGKLALHRPSLSASQTQTVFLLCTLLP